MTPNSTADSTTKKWFDRLQSVLAEQAKLAGLLGHGTLIGNARELFVQRVLKTFLPPAVHVGTGKVISIASGEESRQIDVVLYDSRFPVLEVASGVGLYPIEGVIATIEVKSRASRSELLSAFDNCHSVLNLPVAVQEGEKERRCLELESMENPSSDIKDELRRELHPCTYIFAFDSDMSDDATAAAILYWLGENYPEQRPPCSRLPRLCVFGNVFAMQNLPPMTFHAGGRPGEIPPGPPLMGVWKTSQPFGLLACHLLWAVQRRLGSKIEECGVKLALSAALPAQVYFNNDLNFRTAKMIYPPLLGG